MEKQINTLGFIYMITSPTGRLYVGSTVNVKNRLKNYKSSPSKKQVKLYNSFKKYGFENHIFEIIMTCPINEMRKYETLIGFGFNVLEPENLNLVLPKLNSEYSSMSEETKNKIGLKNKGKVHTDEFKIKLRNANLGRVMLESTKEKISKANKNPSKEIRLKKSKSQLGRIFPQEVRDKISNSHKGKKLSITHKENICKTKYIPIIQYDLNNNFIKRWESIKSASVDLKIANISISLCCRNKRKTAGKFKWKYDNGTT